MTGKSVGSGSWAPDQANANPSDPSAAAPTMGRDHRSRVGVGLEQPPDRDPVHGQRFSGIPTKRNPRSAYWPSSGAEGASSIRSDPDCVFGNAMTSRMFVW